MAWGGAGGPPARAHPVFGRFLKKKLYSFGLTVDPDRDDHWRNGSQQMRPELCQRTSDVEAILHGEY